MDKPRGTEIIFDDKQQGLEVNKNRFFLNRVTGNPWKSNAPYVFPYLKYPRNYVYNLLDYNIWKHFTKDFVLNTLFRMPGQDLLKNKRWCDLQAYFCVFPNEKIAHRELKYIYECIYEMPGSAIYNLLENLKELTFVEQKKHVSPSPAHFKQWPLNLENSQKRIVKPHTQNASVANVGLPNQVIKTTQGNTNAGITYPFEMYNDNITFKRIKPKQNNVFKQPAIPTSSSRSIQKRNSHLMTRNIKNPIQENLQASGSRQESSHAEFGKQSACTNTVNSLQSTDSYQYLHSSLGISQFTLQTKVAENYVGRYPNPAPDNNVPLPTFGMQFGEAVPRFKSFGPYLNASNFEINEFGDISFTGEQNLNKIQSNNDQSKI